MPQITAQSVSAHLRRLGFNGVRSDRSRDGIRVKRTGLPGRVTVVVDFRGDNYSTNLADNLELALTEAGYTVSRTDTTILAVTRPDS